jgi:Fic family protein
MKISDLTLKKQLLDRFRPLNAALAANLDDWFRVELTYTSNALEGNTLTRLETAIVLEKGLTVGGKTLREHLEATNHANALDVVRRLASGNIRDLNTRNILTIHEIVLRSIDEEGAGHFRSVPVRISGSRVILPNPMKVPALMDDFEAWLQSDHGLHPVELAMEAHYRLVTIHPFVDGNGRTARLLMNLILLMGGYPPAIIRKQQRLAYLSSLEKAQLGGSKADFEAMIMRAVNRSLDLYLRAVEDGAGTQDKRTGQLLKIGQLAKAAGQTVPTIRFWTKEGLLSVAEVTESGYQLYDGSMVGRCAEIEKLKQRRLTLAEIRHMLDEKE